MPLSWKVTKREQKLIANITKRAKGMFQALSVQEMAMDITACHANGGKLDLQGLLAADDLNFTHDVLGICQHLDRSTGALRDLFCPRYTAKVPSCH